MNLRSLPAHAVDVSHDHVVREILLLCFTETWTDTAIELQEYKFLRVAKRQNHRAAGVAVYERSDETTLLPRSVPCQLISLPHMSCGDACVVKTSHGFVVAAVYISPATSRKDIMNFLLHNFSAVCQHGVPLIVTGDFNVSVLRRENEWLVEFLGAQLGLHPPPV
ncbi:hypothetical protein HPB50_009687 [Hyalomma asiaticum]|uniref:Uncharacterized protein n=1 Tax=Hyalomma asiaticum TaxID=266040 RepID=A0ACB7THV6_HYAAI|nr:hypothetical protein HPB50_009687 [Hyalomma asiaticum]